MYAGMLGAAGLVLWLLLPFGARGPALELVVLNPDGRFHYEIRVPRVWTDTTGTVPGAVVRVPLILAVRNIGSEAAQATRLELNVPARYRLAHGDGAALVGRLMPGTPLVQYELNVGLPELDPDGAAHRLPVLDTLWLEPIIPSFYCVALADSVPEFVPAPPAPVEAISRVEIFYSFTGGDLEDRQTGLLTVHLDAELLQRESPESPPVYSVQYGHPHQMMPNFAALQYVGARQAFCGEPENPMELMSTLWQTPAGGRFIVLYHGGAPRKYLFDLDRDGIIELEMWDASGDGHFDARRPARLPIPSFLLPPEGPPPYDVARLDSLPEESQILLDRYRGTPYLRYSQRTSPPDTTPRTQRFQPTVIEGVEFDDDTPPGVTRRYRTYGPPADTTATPGRTRLRPPSTAPAPRTGPQPRGRPAPGYPPPPQPQRTAPRTAPPQEAPQQAPQQPTAPQPQQTQPPTAPQPQQPAQPQDEPVQPAPADTTPAQPAADPDAAADRPTPVLRGRPVDSIPKGGGRR